MQRLYHDDPKDNHGHMVGNLGTKVLGMGGMHASDCRNRAAVLPPISKMWLKLDNIATMIRSLNLACARSADLYRGILACL